MKTQDVFQEILSNKHVPLLLNYAPYQSMIKYGQSNKMKEISNQMKELIVIEKKQILEVNSLHKEKSRITANVLYISNEINSQNNLSMGGKLEEQRLRMEQVRQEIKDRENQIQDIIMEKEEMNIDLLKETIDYAYEFMKKDGVELKIVLEEIEVLRQKLKVDREKRDKLEKRVNSIYGFLHAMVGAKDTEKLDEEFLNK